MTHNILYRAGFGALALSTLSGCATTMAPDYERPATVIEDTLPFAAADETRAISMDWAAFFPDATLGDYIAIALENNRDLRIAALNVERARALYGIQRAGLLPSIDASGAYTRQHIGENAATSVLSPTRADSVTGDIYNVTAGVAAYELDLFGRVRSLNEAALESYFATQSAQRATEISLIANVAGAYVQLAANRELLKISRDTLDNQEKALDLTTRLVDAGIGNDVDVQRSRTSIERARADAAVLQAAVARNENALRLLLGTPSLPELDTPAALQDIEITRDILLGASSDILLNRPDILAAESRLKSANANIGAARAAFFPRVQLAASAGTASADLGDLFGQGSGVWSFAPSISLPIFDGGRNRANLKVAQADRDIALAQYEAAIQAAFREVADTLATRSTIDERIDATINLVDASSRTHDLTQLRFRNGVDDYLAVLDAQRSDYSARQELVLARLEDAANVIALYKAVGGVADEERTLE